MNILYGVQATGNGHICRSQEVITSLKALGHKVRVLFSGRPGLVPPDGKLFAPYDIYRGLTFITQRGTVCIWKTACQLDLLRFYRDIHDYAADDLDLVISDYEPISVRIARRRGVPSIGIGHQYAFLHDVPMAAASPATRWIMNHFAPVDHPVGLHWHHFGQPILPPIVPGHLTPAAFSVADKILVYLPFEHSGDIRRLLRAFTSYQFYIYAARGHSADEANLHWRPFSRSGFLSDLKDCAGVISNAGFELASEALQLGKKILVKPLAGQMEQASNALAMRRLGIGRVMDCLDERQTADWLAMPSRSTVFYPDVARQLARWVDNGRWKDITDLAARAWTDTQGLAAVV